MSITHVRIQHAVGQGFFHTGELRPRGGKITHYVYDCGAMKKYAASRQRAIDLYIANVGGPGKTLDILYISHAHADHLNGLPQLLHATKGLKVETIMMPLIPLEERLISFARSASVDEHSATSAFYRDFILDPVATMSRFGPDRIIVVQAGARDDGSPFSVNPNNPDGNRPDIDQRLAQNKDGGWKFYGKGTLERVTDVSGDRSKIPVLSAPDSLAVSVGTGGQQHWILAPYIDPAVAATKSTFMTALAISLGIKSSSLHHWLKTKGNLQLLLTNHVKELTQAYDSVTSDLNVTSLCLYSGPADSISSLEVFHSVHMGQAEWLMRNPESIAWLGTGDAAFKKNARRGRFLKHYAPLLNYVSTLSLPHHGSEGNFHDGLIINVGPRFCIAAADAIPRWRHPGTHVVQRVSSFGLPLHVVTSDVRSTFIERIDMH